MNKVHVQETACVRALQKEGTWLRERNEEHSGRRGENGDETSLLLAHSEPCKEFGFQLQYHEVTSDILSSQRLSLSLM